MYCRQLSLTQRLPVFVFCVATQILAIYFAWCFLARSSPIISETRLFFQNISFPRNGSTNKNEVDTGDRDNPRTVHQDITSLPEHEKPTCIGRLYEWQAEDIFCLDRPQYLANYKNPCFNDTETPDTGQVRCLPYFHLLGADKCGSTDLFDRILHHPEMEPCKCALGKEAYYWCWTRHGVWMKTWNNSQKSSFRKYINFFDPPAKYIIGNASDGYHRHITGDGTPMDFWDFRGWQTIPQNEGLEEPKVLTPHLMRHIYANPKFIIILRNPTERLYSDYFFLGYGSSSYTFHNHSIQAVAMVEKCLTVKSVRQCLFSPELYRDLPMRIHIGCYAVFLKEWFSVFPPHHFLILRNEDYHVENKAHLRKVFQFLELRELPDDQMTEISGRKMMHVTAKKHAAGLMRNDTRAILNQFYSRYNRQLAEMLNDRRFLWEDKQ